MESKLQYKGTVWVDRSGRVLLDNKNSQAFFDLSESLAQLVGKKVFIEVTVDE
jgi:hypothetical protein